MGDLRNCKRCGKLFVYNGSMLCVKCIGHDEEIFQQIKEYIEKHPKCTTMEVSDALDIPVEKILQFLREGKLELGGENTNMLLDCERCGKPIKSGRYCIECAASMDHQFKKGFLSREAQRRREKDQMFTAHRRKNIERY